MKNKVPSTTVGGASRSGHMAKERELLALRRILEQNAQKKYDELDIIFQKLVEVKAKIVETNAKIEEQRQKQQGIEQ